jgi:DNA-binding response OmpR family regulator
MLDEVKIDLTLKNLIYYLFMSNPGISYSRETLLNLVWGYDFQVMNIRQHINRLRTNMNLTNTF